MDAVVAARGTWNFGISPSCLSQRRTVVPGPGIWILEFPPLFLRAGRWGRDLESGSWNPPPLSQSRTVGAGPGIWILESPPLSLRAGRWGRDLEAGSWNFPSLSLSEPDGGAGTWYDVRPCPLLLRELALPRLPKPFVFGIRYSVFGIRSIGYSVAQRGCEARSTSALACTAVAICVRPAWQNHSRCAVST